MKATHNRQRQVQRKCIFCGEGGVPGNPMTFEHLWPEWMHPHLPHADEAKNIAGHHRMRMGELTVKRKVRQGHVFTHRFRVVCKKCNTGWMSQIEDDAKPILMRLITGQRFALLKNTDASLLLG